MILLFSGWMSGEYIRRTRRYTGGFDVVVDGGG